MELKVLTSGVFRNDNGRCKVRQFLFSCL